MKALPTLTTARLVLRPFAPSDAPQVQCLAGDREVASTTSRVPHPYKDGMAEEWIGSHAEAFASGKSISLAITLFGAGTLVGAAGLEICEG